MENNIFVFRSVENVFLAGKDTTLDELSSLWPFDGDKREFFF